MCFVGIGLPSAACNLARLHARAGHRADLRVRHHRHAPGVLPLSIGDGELADTAACVVSVARGVRALPAGAAAWIVGFLGAAQIDRFGNLNSTVIGSYAQPRDAPARRGRRAGDRRARAQTFVIMKAVAAQLRRSSWIS